MQIAENETALVAELSILPDPLVRLEWLTSQGGKAPPLEPAERTPEARVSGCVSEVFLQASFEKGRCRFRGESNSPLIQGLLQLFFRIYDDTPPQAILAKRSNILEQLDLARHITPTRLRGLGAVLDRMEGFARSHL
ncbi:MAG: SufE family protein [Verrucomicrobiota bacterium]